jgi:hypothetical protein
MSKAKGVAAESPVPEKVLEPLLFVQGKARFSLNKFNPVRIPRGEPAVQDDFHGEAGKLDIPRFNQWV